MRDGFRIWDTDTHTRPSAETLEPFFDATLQARMGELKQYKRLIERPVEGMLVGNHSYSFEERIPFARVLGTAGPEKGARRPGTNYMGRRYASSGAIDNNAEARIRDMDEEGVDVQVLNADMPKPDSLNDAELEIGFMRAYNRYLDDHCGKYPHRLKALLPIIPTVIEACVEEIERWGHSPWMAGIGVQMRNDTPLDHPNMEPIWKAANERGLAVIFHSSFAGSPYFPGVNDLWDNAFMARAAAHPWGAMRAVASFIGSGVLERYESLRFGILESGCGWLPFWSRRLDDQFAYLSRSVPEMKLKISEHMMGGRFFSSIEMSEGQDMIEMVIDFMGEGVLMYASDYPHHECRFPESTDYFLGWTLSDELKRRLLWENPVGLYGEP